MNKTVAYATFGGNVERLQTARVAVQSPYFSGSLDCCVTDNTEADLIIGNVPGATSDVADTVSEVAGAICPDAVSAVSDVTGTVKRERRKPSGIHFQVKEESLRRSLSKSLQVLGVDKQELQRLQRKDMTLRGLFGQVRSQNSRSHHRANSYFSIFEGILFRHFLGEHVVEHQVVVPTSLQPTVLVAARNSLPVEHCGRRRTLHRVLGLFFWPRVSTAVYKFLSSGRVCPEKIQGRPVSPVSFSCPRSFGESRDKFAGDCLNFLSPG